MRNRFIHRQTELNTNFASLVHLLWRLQDRTRVHVTRVQANFDFSFRFRPGPIPTTAKSHPGPVPIDPVPRVVYFGNAYSIRVYFILHIIKNRSLIGFHFAVCFIHYGNQLTVNGHSYFTSCTKNDVISSNLHVVFILVDSDTTDRIRSEQGPAAANSHSRTSDSGPIPSLVKQNE